MGRVSSTGPEGQSEPQWQQPAFSPAPEPLPATAVPVERAPVPVPPPSILESMLKVLSGLAWPVMIGLALLGFGGWVANIVIAIIASSVLGAIVKELDRRRRARAQFAAGSRPPELR